MTDADFSQMRKLATDIGHARARTVPRIAAVVKKTMTDTRHDLQAEASGIKHAPGFPRAITYDLSLTGLSGEIGPVMGGAGSLALLYLGNSKTGPVLKDPMFAMARNAAKAEPFFVKALEADL